MRKLPLLVALALAGCTVPGPVDVGAALEVVYDQQGIPAYAGQAIAIQSCGGGAICHRDEQVAEGSLEERIGAPQGLEFDVSLASTNSDTAADEVERLCRSQVNFTRRASLVWGQVSSGAMPPPGERITQPFFRYGADGTRTELPSLNDEGAGGAAAREIFRNWLVSGAPVVERTEGNQNTNCEEPNGVNEAGLPLFGPPGTVIPTCDVTCVEPTWDSIYETIIRPTCSASRCHDQVEPAADLDLRFDEDDVGASARLAWARVVEDGSLSSAEQCSRDGLPMIDTEDDDPMRSIFYRKLVFESDSPSQCGSRMPLSGPGLSEQRLCAIRTWISCGSCAPGDDSCSACVDAGRAACGVTEAGECATETVCRNR